MASFSAQQQLRTPTPYGTTAAPPPTPSQNHHHHHHSTSASAEDLSRLLHRLPAPSLSLPTRFSLPLFSLSSQNPQPPSQLGYFQLTDHSIPSQLSNSAQSESLSLFSLSKDQKIQFFPQNWPLGYDGDDELSHDLDESFCIDSESETELPLSSLKEFTRALEKVGLQVIDLLSRSVGFDNPLRDDPTQYCSLMWVSSSEGLVGNNKPVFSGKMYPYIVGLQYQLRSQKYSLLSDSGWVTVSPRVDSVLVTIGDIAQVWSNGKLKKVRGRPVPNLGDDNISNKAHTITMTLLVSLPMESTIAPLVPAMLEDEAEDEADHGDEDKVHKRDQERAVFRSFSFEDYAWRVYHERLLLKDPLDRYRV
ncbi:hypothetical protein RJ641_035894 [Dillenia turbinata]|uniref:Isopenicillin N synthase-like Fe(2+) 2OG dioxygenase domain-containing protein n=1 Tax=Dillenia turbinata TaxID=194707 RepID=A0AAN8ZFT5_9MAGN